MYRHVRKHCNSYVIPPFEATNISAGFPLIIKRYSQLNASVFGKSKHVSVLCVLAVFSV
jgi:hypothetical protein